MDGWMDKKNMKKLLMDGGWIEKIDGWIEKKDGWLEG